MSASDQRLGDLIDDINALRLKLRPPFQRRLVWTNKDKEYFIETVIKGLPFPEIFICTGETETNKQNRTRWLVDGQQRMTTLRDYVSGSDDILCTKVPRFDNLTDDQRGSFLDTTVAVRDLRRVTEEQLKEIFTRINSTNYQLKAMEKRNAMFSGAFKQYCDALSSQEFFVKYNVFSAGRKKRMEDLAFCVILVTTLLCGYYQRDSKNAEYLERYNDDFSEQDTIQRQLDNVFNFIQLCEFPIAPRSPVWKQTNLFTVIVELHHALIVRQVDLDFLKVRRRLTEFFNELLELDNPTSKSNGDPDVVRPATFLYYKSAKTAANDKHSRVQRAEVISAILQECVTKKASRSATSIVDSAKKKKNIPKLN